MSHYVALEPAFILHRRPYSNTSLILDLFTLNHGRITALAKSARGLKSRYKGIFQLFCPLLLSWTGQRDLKLLGNAEIFSMPYLLDEERLLCGFYLNELLTRLLHKEDAHPKLFQDYQSVLDDLMNKQEYEFSLRLFEKRLLNELGYGLPLQEDFESKLPIDTDSYYQYVPDRGFLRCDLPDERSLLFPGASLLALRNESFLDETALYDIKRLMRAVLSRLLGERGLKSRELFLE